MLPSRHHPLLLCPSLSVVGFPLVLLLLPPPRLLLRADHPSLELLPTDTPSRRREEAAETATHLVLPADIQDDASAADAGGRRLEPESGST